MWISTRLPANTCIQYQYVVRPDGFVSVRLGGGGSDPWLGSSVPISVSTHLCLSPAGGARSDISLGEIFLSSASLTEMSVERGRVWKQPMEDIAAISQTPNFSSRWPGSRRPHFLALQFAAHAELQLTLQAFILIFLLYNVYLRHFKFL